MSNFRLTFAQRLKETRKNNNFTQAELANLINVTSATISAYEKATDEKGKMPSLENAVELSEKLGVSLDWLCGRKNDSSVETSDLTGKQFLQLLISAESRFKRVNQSFTMLVEKTNSLEQTKISIQSEAMLKFVTAFNRFKELYNNGALTDDLFNLSINALIDKYAHSFDVQELALNAREEQLRQLNEFTGGAIIEDGGEFIDIS